ncbi:MAG: hypothetical protein JWO31_580 [Phycisphaerales bacterium]|nr:hypothetical protein [Phycisphaerales bacterium]
MQDVPPTHPADPPAAGHARATGGSLAVADRPEAKVPPAPPDARSDAEPNEQLPRPLFVHLAVLLAIGGTLLTIGSIGWRWYRVRFPEAVILVRSDASCDGALVTITDEDGRQVHTGRLSSRTDPDGLVVLVEQGVFTVRVDRGKQSLLATRLFVRNGGGVIVDVAPSAAPATKPADARPGSSPATAPG